MASREFTTVECTRIYEQIDIFYIIKSIHDEAVTTNREIVANHLAYTHLYMFLVAGVFIRISAGDFKNGLTLEIDGNVVQIMEFQHVKPGKGAAFVRTKLKNVINGGVVEKTFRPTEKFPQARIDRVDMQYLYNDGDLYYFMNNETYDQIAIDNETVGDSLKFVKENEVVKVCSYNGSVFAIEAPLFVELEITETEPGFKGDTAQGATKPAIVETGATVYVPLFVDQGDRIKIDTRTGEYLSRV